jgi:S-adenosylmethionine:tRNA ribosyltransferase-isomerase
MKLDDLDYTYPQDLIATEPRRPSRVLWVEDASPQEITISELINRIPRGDILVINDTKVLKRRVFSTTGIEILFIEQLDKVTWKVLYPSSRFSKEQEVILPEGVTFQLLESGLPQTIRLSQELSDDYFNRCGELPLPPYIQKSRDQRHNLKDDEKWYQTAWAKNPGSQAAPTASLHFTHQDIESLKAKGVQVIQITLHVGLGTFLPVKTNDLASHKMHSETVYVDKNSWNLILESKARGAKIWALGTTVVRTLESLGRNLVPQNFKGDYDGSTEIFIYDEFEFKVVDRILTNFHQPKTTLMALIASFAGLSSVKKAYSWAIEKKFRLFSYGDLSVWIK